MKATRKRRLCPTCGSSIDRGPGKHTYCSEACRPTCIHPTCNKPTRGADDACASHQAQRRRHGELRPDRWAKEWICVVCGKNVQKGSGRRKHCSSNCQQLDARARRKACGLPTPQRKNHARPMSSTCRLCGRDFSLLVKSGSRIQRSDTQWCPDCGRDSPEVIRYRRYGVTPDAYAAALLNGCDICGIIADALHVDHDHACCPPVRGNGATCGKCVRGIICGPCNRAIGMFKDNPDIIRRAAAYLER